MAAAVLLSDRAVVETLPAALRGDEAAARRYARAWRELVRELLAEHPDAPPAAGSVLDRVALVAPFDPEGLLHALMSVAAGMIEGMPPPPASASSAWSVPEALAYERFARVVLDEISGTGFVGLMAVWGLNVTEAGRLFGVSRQAVQQWLDHGVPAARQTKLLTVLRISDLLERNLRPERIPAVVREPAAAYGGRSMLEMIAADEHEALLDSLAQAFDWSATA